MRSIFLKKKQRGFTIIEVVMSLAVFLIVMVATSGIFSSIFSGYKNTKSIQRDTENAQYALNVMAKELRTSSIATPAIAATVSAVRFYDYSQNICISYRISGSNLEYASIAPTGAVLITLDTAAKKLNFCQTATLSAYTTVSTGIVTGSFVVTPSTVGSVSVGKVTVALQIAEGTNHAARIQTSMSLRDYNYTGI